MIKRVILISLLILTALGMSAQTSKFTREQREEQKKAEYREKIGIDLSVPDYDVKSPNAKVMGWRLAKMLQSLEKNYNQGIYSQMHMTIRAEQPEDQSLLYVPAEKIKIQRIMKTEKDLTIIIKTSSKSESVGWIDYDFNLKFNKGVSDSDATNIMFRDLSRYIKEDEQTNTY